MPDRTLLAFYGIGFRELIPIYPLYAIMFGENGISAMELAWLFTLWASVALIIEVPSGALADRFSRKWLVVSSAFFKSGCFISWYLWQDFWGYALGFVLWGIGSAIKSGAWEALLFDILQALDKSAEFSSHYARINSIAMICIGTGELLGGFLIVQGYGFVLLISAMIPLLAIVPFALWVSDVRKQEHVFEEDYLQTLRTGLTESYTSYKVRYIVLAYGLLLVIAGVYDEYSGPFLREHAFDLQMIAFMGAGIFFCQALGMAAAGHFSKVSIDKLLIIMAIGGISLLLAAVMTGFSVPIALACYFGLFGFAATAMGSLLQHSISSAARATVTSVASFAEGLGAIGGFLAFGLIAELSSMIGATLATAISTLIMAASFASLRRRWLPVADNPNS